MSLAAASTQMEGLTDTEVLRNKASPQMRPGGSVSSGGRTFGRLVQLCAGQVPIVGRFDLAGPLPTVAPPAARN